MDNDQRGSQARRGEALAATTRAVAAQSADGRLPLGESVSWDIFPFDGAISIRPLDDPQLPEPPLSGAGGVDCTVCARATSESLWTDGRWTVREMGGGPHPLLTVFLEPVEHVDLTDLDDDGAADLGRHIVRVTRAIQTLPGVGRVHVNRWGDGAEHLHIWFFVRPAGMLQLRGSGLADWFDLLPPMSQEDWDSDLADLRIALA